ELAVERQPEYLRVAVGEVAVALAELGDLGRTDEREVERPAEQHQPFAGEALLGELLELLAPLAGDGRGESERRDAVAYGLHGSLRFVVGNGRRSRRGPRCGAVVFRCAAGGRAA